MTQYGDRMFNPDLRPYQCMEKTFFRQAQQLYLSQPKEVLGDFAYFDFGVRIPDRDLFVPAEATPAERGNEPKPLPPSILVQPPNTLQPAAHSLYPFPSILLVLIVPLYRSIPCYDTRPDRREARQDINVSEASSAYLEKILLKRR